MYYTPHVEPPVYRLSRFTYDGSWIDNERVILEIPRDPLDRDHSGGSMDFDAEGNLYLSTGDNTLATFSSGYSPMEDAATGGFNDSRRTAANTADLRGKILRILPLPIRDSLPQPPGPGSTYAIPAGNLREAYADLWPTDSMAQKVRWEIWAMGTRNPFRLAVDRRRGWVHWGDIGPDAAESSETRGPLGHDEFNVATRPGNYGWPFFVGHNLPFRVFNFASGVSGAWCDPLAPRWCR